MTRCAGLALAALALVGVSAGLAWRFHVPEPDVVHYAVFRLAAIQQHLDEADPGYVLVAGDSQAELQGATHICGTEVVNAGISGATASGYAEHFALLHFAAQPRAAMLTIGTNDLLRKHDPLAGPTIERFAQDVGRIVASLRKVVDRVVVTALPPLGRESAPETEPRAVEVYSRRIADLCTKAGCIYADPYADLREAKTGFGRPGANRDGLHLARYRPVLKALEPALCPDGPSRG